MLVLSYCAMLLTFLNSVVYLLDKTHRLVLFSEKQIKNHNHCKKGLIYLWKPYRKCIYEAPEYIPKHFSGFMHNFAHESHTNVGIASTAGKERLLHLSSPTKHNLYKANTLSN